jgi:ethanolamine utilization protein EutN
MQIGRVVGTVVSTIKDKDHQAHKLLLVQPLGLDMEPEAGQDPLICIDIVGAGESEEVMFLDEGNCARQLLDLDSAGSARAVIVGIVDELDVEGQPTWRKRGSAEP